MKPPAGVTVLVVVMILAGLGFVGTSVVFFLLGSTAARAAAPDNVLAIVNAALGSAAGVIFLLFGLLHVVLAVGIFRMLNLARVFTIFLFVLIAAGACLGLIATLLSLSRLGLAWNASILGLDLLGLWYLLRPATSKAFRA